MRFYTQQHKHYCGVDLHTKMMYVCIVDLEDNILLHKNISTDRNKFLNLIAPFREDMVVGVECIFSWYWLADLCSEEGISFLLGHALYMKAIHGGKTKNDKIDSLKIAKLIKGGTFPMAYVYPNFMRATRDLLRRRMYFVHIRSEIQAHIHLTNYQYNLPCFEKKLERKSNRVDIAERFRDLSVSKNVESDLSTMDHFEVLIKGLEAFVVRYTKAFDSRTYFVAKMTKKHGKGKAISILAHKLGRAVYFVWRRQDSFDEKYFFQV